MRTPILFVTFAALPLAAFAAEFTGTWKSEFDSQIGIQKYTFTFKQDGADLTGKADSEVNDRKRETDLKEGKVDGDTISFVELLNFQDNEIRITYKGKLSANGNEIRFTREVGDFAREEIVAKRSQIVPVATVADVKPLRIKAGLFTPFKDSSGNVWLPEQGFEGGATIDRDPGTVIEGTKDPDLFLTEHYSMDSFAIKIPNGKYIAKLYFAETFEGITGPGDRVFSFNVQGREFKDFDVWVKAGGPNRAYIETVPVEVTNGEFRITFTPNVENPEINAIEIIPQTAAEAGAETPAPVATTPSTPSATFSARSADKSTLKDAYKEYFHVGVAINRTIATATAVRADNVNRNIEQVEKDIELVKQQFNQITPENDLKWALIHPREGADGYDFGPADAFVNFGVSNDMYLIGHTLVWHAQTPNWVFAGTNPPPPAVTDTPSNSAADTNADPTIAPRRGRSGRGFGGGFGRGFTVARAHRAKSCSSGCAITFTPLSVATRARSRSGTL